MSVRIARIFHPGGDCPPVFYWEASPEDLLVLGRQNKSRRFDPGLVLGVSRVCAFDIPQVIVCRPARVTQDARSPFPTLFWLTCPYLNRLAASCESQGKLTELERFLQQEPNLARWNAFHAQYAALRRGLLENLFGGSFCEREKRLGVGGIAVRADQATAKCLHLQIATWLGWRENPHPAAAWLKGLLGEPLECSSGTCRH